MRRLFLSVLAATAVLTTACGGDSSTGPGAGVAGTYSLQTVNSKSLPYAYYDDGTEKEEVLLDSYTLSATGTYTNRTVTRSTISGTATTDTLNYSGTYKQDGNAVTLTDSKDATDQVTAVVSGATFTVSIPGLVLVYRRP